MNDTSHYVREIGKVMHAIIGLQHSSFMHVTEVSDNAIAIGGRTMN